jgi:hypothetical protein
MLFNLRRIRRTYVRRALLVIAFILVIDSCIIISSRPHTTLSPLVSTSRSSATTHPVAPRNRTVYIATIHRNSGEVLKLAWNDALVKLVEYLGPHNVHVTAIESGSQDDTKDQLKFLKERLDNLHVPNTITLGMTVWEQLDEISKRPKKGESRKDWLWHHAMNRWELRRIPYLSKTRNQAMEPLKKLEKEGKKFETVLWLNDVVFDVSGRLFLAATTRLLTSRLYNQTQDIITLLDTRDGNYAAACAMDFTLYPYYYDTFALRDDRGDKTASYYWPWFHSPTSRAAALANEPIPVQSCWNGAVAFQSAPFYAEPGLKFRGVDDSLADLHLEASECCLIHPDNYLTKEKGVWLNPNVRVGYNIPVYKTTKPDRFPTPRAAVMGAWANRFLRWHGGLQVSLEKWTVQGRLKQWVEETPEGDLPRYEPGEVCLINEAQVMWENGWKHL